MEDFIEINYRKPRKKIEYVNSGWGWTCPECGEAHVVYSKEWKRNTYACGYSRGSTENTPCKNKDKKNEST